MQLEELFDYKNRLVYDLLSNEKIVEIISRGFPVDDPADLVYKRIFPYEYVPETIEEAGTYICCDVDIQRSYNKTFLEPVIYVWIFTHKSQIRHSEGGVVTDKLACEISKTVNGSRFYGLGELDLYSVRRFAPIADYQGKIMTFNAKDFNRTYTPNKPTPENRKQW